MTVTVAAGASFDRRVRRNRIWSRIALGTILKADRCARLAARNKYKRNADRCALEQPRSEIGEQRAIRASRFDVRRRIAVHRERVYARVPDVVGGEDLAWPDFR